MSVGELQIPYKLSTSMTNQLRYRYEDKNDLDRQIEQFGNKVGFIIAAEMTGKVSSEEAYQMIKSEMKGLKEYRKLFKRDSVEKRKGKRD